MMIDGDLEGRNVLSKHHTINGFFFLLTIKYRIFMFLDTLRCNIICLRHFNVTLTSLVFSTYGMFDFDLSYDVFPSSAYL